MKKNYIGIDVSFSGIRVAMLNEAFELTCEEHQKLPAATGKESLAARIQKTFLEIPQGEHISAVGVSLPATYEAGNKKIVSSPLPNLNNVKIYELLADKIKYPLFFFRRNNTALLAEQALGEAVNKKNVVYLEVGKDISASFLINGRVIKGASDRAGEISKLIIDVSKEKNNGLGEFGSLVSGKGIQDLTGKSVYEYLKGAQKNDLTVKQIVRDITEGLLTGMYNLKTILDPELFILNGDILDSYGLFTGAFLDLGVAVRQAKFKQSASAVGAGISAYNQLKLLKR